MVYAHMIPYARMESNCLLIDEAPIPPPVTPIPPVPIPAPGECKLVLIIVILFSIQELT